MQRALENLVGSCRSSQVSGVALLALVLATACTGPPTDSGGQSERVARPLAASLRPSRNGDPNAQKQILLPEPVRSAEELRQQGFDAVETAFRKSWLEGAPEYVVEGTVTSANAEIIPNNTSVQRPGASLIATRYEVAAVSSWGRAPAKPEFWVLGGRLPPDAAAKAGVAPGDAWSFEVYPTVGDSILVAVKMLPFPDGSLVPRPVWNGDSVLAASGKGGLPADVVAKAREQLNANFSR